MLLELLDRVESAVRQRRQSGSPQTAQQGIGPLIFRGGRGLALLGDSVAVQNMALSLEAISEKTEGEGDSPQPVLGCQDKGLAIVPGGSMQLGEEGSGEGAGGEGGPLALGVSAAELAALQAAFGLDEGDWQDEALLQEVRAACLAAEGHAPQATTPQAGHPQLATATERERDGAEQNMAGDLELFKDEERTAVVETVAGEAAGAGAGAGAGAAAAEGWEGQPRVEGDAAAAGGVDRALLQHQFVVTQVGPARCCCASRQGAEATRNKGPLGWHTSRTYSAWQITRGSALSGAALRLSPCFCPVV